MKNNSWWFVFLLLVCSCTQADLDNPSVQGPRIRLSAGMSVQSETRGVIDAGYTADLLLNFLLCEQNASTGAYPPYTSFSGGMQLPAARTGGAGYTGVSFEAGSEQYYPVRDTHNKVKLVGWYPRVNGGTVTLSSGVLSFGIDGSTDVMLTPEVEGSKVAGDQFSDAGKEFTFNHLLTQLRVKAYAADAAAATAWGTLSSVRVKNRLPVCKVTLPATVSFEGTAADLPLVERTVATDAPIAYPLSLPAGESNALECGYAMTDPVELPAVLELEVTTQYGGTRTVRLDAQNYQSGKAYAINLKFTATGITARAQIGQWTVIPLPDIEL